MLAETGIVGPFLLFYFIFSIIKFCYQHDKESYFFIIPLALQVAASCRGCHYNFIASCSKLQWISLRFQSKMYHHHQCKLQQVAMNIVVISFQVATSCNSKLQQVAMYTIAISFQVATSCNCKLQ